MKLVAISFLVLTIILYFFFPKMEKWYNRPKKMMYIGRYVGPGSARTDPSVCPKEYDFSKINLPASDFVRFQKNCWTKVTLPPQADYDDQYNTPVEIIFADGDRYENGPGKSIWYKTGSAEMKIRGKEKDGMASFSFQKKKT